MDIDAAEHFLAANARVLERRRFERLVRDGGAAPVRDAVAAYRNADGGFGHALEPDGRAPGSQPAAVEQALRILDEADAWDEDLVAGACDWLERAAPEEGGIAFVDPAIEGWPHAPWWRPQAGGPPSLTITGQVAGTLNARGIEHPWLERATAWLWRRVGEGLSGAGPYDLYGVLAFLDHVPDRERAEAVWPAVEPALAHVVTLDPEAPGEVHGPLGFAPAPGSLARRAFDPAVIEDHLDHLDAGQQDDGGWTFNWPAWSPAAELAWRGERTVAAVRLLRANGRSTSTGS